MSRTKQVFDTREIAHLWVHQSQESGRNPQDNLSWRDDRLYSYSTCVARLVKAKRGPHKGETAVFLTKRRYSNTTAKHRQWVRQAANHLRVFVVPYIGCDQELINVTMLAFKKDVAVATQEYLNPLSATGKKKTRPQVLKCFAELQAAIQRCVEFAEFFGLRYTPPKVKDADSLLVELDMLAEKRIKAIERANLKRQREIQQQLETRRQEVEKLAEEWRSGVPWKREFYDLAYFPPMLRISEERDNVETSYGVSFPLAHAVRVLPFVEKLLQHGQEWVTNGKTIHLGTFQVDRIDADGTVHAGCHHIPKDEVLRLIAELKASESSDLSFDNHCQ